MNKKILIIGGAVLLVGGLVTYFILKNKKSSVVNKIDSDSSDNGINLGKKQN